MLSAVKIQSTAGVLGRGGRLSSLRGRVLPFFGDPGYNEMTNCIDGLGEVSSLDPGRSQHSESRAEPHANVILVGVMGSGKSTVGRLLAHSLGFGFIDTDAAVVARAKKSVARIFSEQGESAFRDLERKEVLRAAGARRHVIATGGGAVEDDEVWRALSASGIVVWLNPSIEELVRRMAPGPEALKALAHRPFLEDLADISALPHGAKGPVMQQFMEDRRKRLAERLGALLGRRVSRYREAAVVVEPAWELPETTARAIASRIREMES